MAEAARIDDERLAGEGQLEWVVRQRVWNYGYGNKFKPVIKRKSR
jgi:hypothetical protein